MTSLGAYIKEKRTEKGISARELARRSGVSQAYISQLETGKNQNPTVELIRRIAAGLGLSYLELWSGWQTEIKKREQEQYDEQRLKSITDALSEALEGKPEDFQDTIPVKVPSRIEYDIEENNSLNRYTRETDLFDLFYLLNMDTDIYYKEKVLSDDDKKFILQVLERTISR